ncbi:MAG: TonB-dependent receptor [Prevotella sp.]|jgi:TonB-linked SusC/RagA family outer membrane protein|nr:TonB-dependent receptor [Prevotella sp.]
MDEKLEIRSFGLLRLKRQWKYLFAASFLLFAPLCVSAGESNTNGSVVAEQQQAKKTVTGTVLDENGQPVVGATVVEKGTTNGTMTDIDGKFSLKVDPNSKLSVSYVGYKSQDLVVRGNSVSVNLKQDTEALDEVVVVAYGTQKKKDLTGAMTDVKAENIAVQNTTTVSRALEGAAPGIQVAAMDGQPGYDMGIRLRGVSSANGNSANALIVIDGVVQQTNTTFENPLSQLDPNDIASISVLKDAASTALYGSRGANGVILITTKKGKSGKATVNFEARWGWNSAGPYQTNSIDNAAQYYEYAWQSIYNSYRYGVNNGLPGTDANGYPTTNVKNPNHSDEEARQFASAHLFDYTGSETSFQKNAMGNYMAYSVPGAIYTNTGSGNNSSSTMSGAYLVDPTTGRINPSAKLLYQETLDDVLLRTAFRQEYNLSASGGSDKIHYYFSLGYQTDPSYLKSSDYSRLNGRANIDAQMFDWLKVGANVGYSHTRTRAQAGRWGTRNIGATSGNSFNYIRGYAPVISVYQYDANGNVILNDDGTKAFNVGPTYSPLGAKNLNDGNPWGRDFEYELKMNLDRQQIATWTSRLYAEFSFLKYFKFNVNFNMDETNWRHTRYQNGTAGLGRRSGYAYGGISIDTYFRRVWNTQQLLTYSEDFDKHHVDAMLGHEYEDIDRKDVNFGSGSELIAGVMIPANFTSRYWNVQAGSNPGWSLNKSRMESYLGRANYNYAEKYYASASFRRDGSSHFISSKRWGTFWSLGAGWRISEEEFMKSTKTWLDNAKLRASYGTTGNASGVSGYYNHTWSYGVSTWTTQTNGTGHPSTYAINSSAPPADYLTWESVHQLDFGLDFSVLNSRITGALDYFNNLTSNSYYQQTVSPLANLNYSSLTRNAAKLRNYGFEVELDADIVRTKNWTLSVGTNGSHYRTELVKVPAEQIPYWDNTIDLPKNTWTANGEEWAAAGGMGGGVSSNIFYLRGEGKDWYNIYLYKYAGVDQETGLPMYWHRVTYSDVNADKSGNYAHSGRYTTYKQGDNVKTTVSSDASRYEMGSATPDWIGGFNISLRYKDFDLGVVAAYQLGGKFFSTDYANWLYRGSFMYPADGDEAVSKDLIGNTWSPVNSGAKYPMQWWANGKNVYYDGSTTGSWQYTDMGLFSASYLRIKNITLGYTLPKVLCQKIGISKLRAFVSADNMIFFSPAQGVDPSMSVIGGFEIGAMVYPQMQTVTIGVNLEI